MGKETMVTTTLTEEMIASGKALMQKMDGADLRPNAALWLYDDDTQRWKLLIAEDKLKTEGPRMLYEQIQNIIAHAKKDMPGMSLDSIVLTNPDTQIIKLLKKAVGSGTNFRFTNNVINGMVIDDAYIYRLS